ncbi:hypothetical protein HPB48_000037 [Haemaphysalis longicornis]|uniref:MULE transposase domain-containing protein n=1 Tax=Haemaphysalis longicornis TaxID=44386 RepID=A0A9J6FXS0_HAELO|nr:hypothetical protein HPB48_000037 [Haemaphysalis longicornis]
MPGVDVRTWTSKDGSSWAVLVVTAIMSRTQALGTAKEMVFLDSTASCDETQSTVTVVLTATPVGAMPLAVLLHSSQSTESYKAAFDRSEAELSLCFGGAPAPQCFMTDNSAAERAALEATWPEATRLLCHFHVAQAEWRWLQASRNQIMYAASAVDLEAAIEQLHDMNHKEYVQRVTTFLERKAEWLLYHKLLERMPSGAAEMILAPWGQQVRGQAPAGLLALGDNCPDEDFFRDFRDNFRQEASTSRPTGQGQSAEPEPQQPMDTEPQLEAQGSTGSCHQHEDAAELLKQIQEEQWRQHSLAAGNPYYTTALRKMLDHMRKIGKESQVVSSYLAMNAACASARRRGRTIKVQTDEHCEASPWAKSFGEWCLEWRLPRQGLAARTSRRQQSHESCGDDGRTNSDLLSAGLGVLPARLVGAGLPHRKTRRKLPVIRREASHQLSVGFRVGRARTLNGRRDTPQLFVPNMGREKNSG